MDVRNHRSMHFRRFITKLQMPLFVGILMGIIAVAGAVGYIVGQHGHSQNTQPKVAAAAPSTLLTEIDKVYKLPLDEQPTIVTIKDQDKLKDQTFFKDAQNGDQLVMYSKNKLAIIYRQAEHKLINVGPINYNNASQ